MLALFSNAYESYDAGTDAKNEIKDAEYVKKSTDSQTAHNSGSLFNRKLFHSSLVEDAWYEECESRNS